MYVHFKLYGAWYQKCNQFTRKYLWTSVPASVDQHSWLYKCPCSNPKFTSEKVTWGKVLPVSQTQFSLSLWGRAWVSRAPESWSCSGLACLWAHILVFEQDSVCIQVWTPWRSDGLGGMRQTPDPAVEMRWSHEQREPGIVLDLRMGKLTYGLSLRIIESLSLLVQIPSRPTDLPPLN